jgi:hypothetical protein
MEIIPNKNYLRAGMVTAYTNRVLVVGVIFLPTGSYYGAIIPISECNFSTEHQKVP